MLNIVVILLVSFCYGIMSYSITLLQYSTFIIFAAIIVTFPVPFYLLSEISCLLIVFHLSFTVHEMLIMIGYRNNCSCLKNSFIATVILCLLSSQQQHLIELIRQGDIEGALTYAQSHLAEHGEEDNKVLPELERTLALLAFEQPDKSPFSDLLEVSQRQKVKYDIKETMMDTLTQVQNQICFCFGFWSHSSMD